MKKVSVFLFSFILFLYTMLGVHAWFFWPLEDKEHGSYMKIALFSLTCLCVLYLKMRKMRLTHNYNVKRGLVFFVLAYLVGLRFTPWSFVYAFFLIIPLWVLLSEVDTDRITRNLVNILAFTMIPGIILHLYMVVNDTFIPGLPMMHPNNANYYFANYGFLLKGIGEYEADGLRFQSYFLEPGYLGTFFAFLLYTIRFDFSKYKLGIVLLISEILSLSLAGYFLTVIGFILSQRSKGKRISFFIPVFVFAVLIYIVANTYNDGDNYVNKKIIERLEVDDEKGIKGNNRAGEGTDYYFERSLLDGSFIFGLGYDRIEKINGGKGWEDNKDYNNQIRGAGYKVYILQKGIVSAVLFLLAYYYIGVRVNRDRKYSWGYFFIVFVTFLQASYPESFSWLIPYILGTRTNH